MFPAAGGLYAFLREGWGRLPAFLYGWCLLLVINTGALAALSVVFATSLASVVPLGPIPPTAVAAAMILTIAAVNHRGVRWGAVLQNLSTFAKLASLARSCSLASFLGALPATAGAREPPRRRPGSWRAS